MKHEILAPGIEIYCADCLDVMQSFDYQQFDLTWTDPPYNVGKKYDGYDDDVSDEKYWEWVNEWLGRVKHISKQIAIYPPKIKLRQFWNLIPDQHLVICAWSPEGAIRGNFVHQYAPLLVPNKPTQRTKDHWWNVQISGMGYFYRETKYDHPAQTSLDITQRVIRAFTNPGDWILDPFGGTGTTAEACIKFARKCVLIEQSEKYYAIAKRRIKEALMQPRLL